MLGKVKLFEEHCPLLRKDKLLKWDINAIYSKGKIGIFFLNHNLGNIRILGKNIKIINSRLPY